LNHFNLDPNEIKTIMQIVETNLECLSQTLDQMIQEDHILHIAYGHINEKNMVYVKYGIYNEYKVIQEGTTFTFEYVCGDRLFGYKILNQLKHRVEQNEKIPSENHHVKEQPCNKEEYFLQHLITVDDSIFKSNSIEYITQLSIQLSKYLMDVEFRELYVEKYEYIMYEKMEQYLRFNSENATKIISLFHLINIIYFYCPLEEYKHLVSKYVQSTHPYVQKIGNDMLTHM